MKKFLHIVFVSTFLFATVAAQTKPVDFAELEKTIEAELAAAKTPGAAVVVVKDDKIVFMKGFGVTNAESGNPVTPDTLFRMGSTTKMFTAAAVVALADAGKIRLDAPVGIYIKNPSPKIVYRQSKSAV